MPVSVRQENGGWVDRKEWEGSVGPGGEGPRLVPWRGSEFGHEVTWVQMLTLRSYGLRPGPFTPKPQFSHLSNEDGPLGGGVARE